MIERRSILTALVGLVAAPAIIKVAGIMPVNAKLQPRGVGWNYNTQTGLWTEIVQYPVVPQASVDVLYGSLEIGDTLTIAGVEDTFRVTDVMRGKSFLERMDGQYREQFGREGDKIGSQLRIRLPSDYTVNDVPDFTEYYRGEQWTAREIAAMKARQAVINAEHQPVSPVAVAALGAAAVLTKNPTVSRRFWAK